VNTAALVFLILAVVSLAAAIVVMVTDLARNTYHPRPAYGFMLGYVVFQIAAAVCVFINIILEINK
jgi:hypothetical protein